MEDKKQTDKKKGKNYGQSYSMEGSGSIDALKSTMEHLHWYEGQLALRKEEKPGTAALAAIAASICSSPISNPNPVQAVDLAWELWSAARHKLQVELEPDDQEQIESRLKELGRDWRVAFWPTENDGSNKVKMEFTRFVALFLPIEDKKYRRRYFAEYLKQNPEGDPRPDSEVKKLIARYIGRGLTHKDYREHRVPLVRWWMNHERFNPLKFPKGSIGRIQFDSLLMKTTEKKTTEKKKNEEG